MTDTENNTEAKENEENPIKKAVRQARNKRKKALQLVLANARSKRHRRMAKRGYKRVVVS